MPTENHANKINNENEGIYKKDISDKEKPISEDEAYSIYNLTDKQYKFYKLYLENQNKKKSEKETLFEIAKRAGYSCKSKTTAYSVASRNIRIYKKRGLITAFEDNKINDDYIAKYFLELLEKGKKAKVKSSDAVQLLKLLLQVRQDITSNKVTYETTIKQELKELSEQELQQRLDALRSKRNANAIDAKTVD